MSAPQGGLRLAIRPALKASGSGQVAPTPDGTHLIMRMELDPHGLLKLATPFLRHRLQSMYKRDVDNIKARLEGDSGTDEGA